MDAFEERPQQREMASYVRDALAGGGQYLVEAGTGVGKSLAYLVPAALHALHNERRVVVSTNTIGLQEQLLTKDIPALRQMLVDAGVIESDEDLRVSLLKGRANYLCLQRWTASYGASMADPDFGRLASSMLLWLPETETGDRSELGLDHNDYLTWQRVSAQDADCLSRQNSWVREGYCFLARARRAAESAHIIIVNHALLLADLAAGGSAIPAYDALIVDEAHNLEETATRQFGASVSRRQLHGRPRWHPPPAWWPGAPRRRRRAPPQPRRRVPFGRRQRDSPPRRSSTRTPRPLPQHARRPASRRRRRPRAHLRRHTLWPRVGRCRGRRGLARRRPPGHLQPRGERRPGPGRRW
ncbi:MAG: hypothetical protein U5Q44_00150 [Dehalococcoidia bacterium]|nr:hypothetical protein [Dehalococcoidia bacterium]